MWPAPFPEVSLIGYCRTTLFCHASGEATSYYSWFAIMNPVSNYWYLNLSIIVHAYFSKESLHGTQSLAILILGNVSTSIAPGNGNEHFWSMYKSLTQSFKLIEYSVSLEFHPLAMFFKRKSKSTPRPSPTSTILLPLYVYPSPGAWAPLFDASVNPVVC